MHLNPWWTKLLEMKSLSVVSLQVGGLVQGGPSRFWFFRLVDCKRVPVGFKHHLLGQISGLCPASKASTWGPDLPVPIMDPRLCPPLVGLPWPPGLGRGWNWLFPFNRPSEAHSRPPKAPTSTWTRQLESVWSICEAWTLICMGGGGLLKTSAA